MGNFNLVAPCLFGVEGIAADEFKRMGFEGVTAENGRVLLSGNDNMLARANIFSRFAERILINVGQFTATTFEDLFQGIKALPWENYIGKYDSFPVNGWSINSQLASIPDCQSIVKKAIVERLKQKYGISWFPETGANIAVRFSIHKNQVTAMIDTSGEGLHKRGYRKNSNAAPLKETLAAAICDTARIYPDTVLYDPFCGSGTLLIESALMATKTAPGLYRNFAAENFGFIADSAWQEERARARDQIKRDIEFCAFGSDIDPACVELTMHNAKKAGVEKFIKTKVANVKDFSPTHDRFTLITNPPYGERLLDLKAAEKLYKVMGERFVSGQGKKYFVISAHDEFEKHFNRESDKKRKLYNGMIRCQLYMFFKQRG